jgi:hypothetical protein
MSRGGPDRFIVEQNWNGYTVYVDSKGTFFALDGDDNNRLAEGKTLDALKHKLSEPPEKLDVKAIIFDRWSYIDSEEQGRIVNVYGISGIGSVLYEEKGIKQRASKHDKVYVYDQERLAERKRMQREKKRISNELHKLMEDWPLVGKRA